MNYRRFLPFLILAFSLSISNFLFAQTNGNSTSTAGENLNATKIENKEEGKEEKKGINITELVFGHVSDSHSWHLFTIVKNDTKKEIPVAIPLPIIVYQPDKGFFFFLSNHFEEWQNVGGDSSFSNSYESNGTKFHLEKKMKEKVVAEDGKPVMDLSITKNTLSMLIGITLLLWVMLTAAKKYKIGTVAAPKGFQNFVEVVVVFIRDEVAKPNLGKKYLKFTPFLLTIFFFIWINNLLGLLPGGANFTGNIAVTACLALITFVVMMANSSKYFWSHLLNPPNVPFLVKCLLVLIEVMSLIIKPVALMIRLFANMLAGHIVILSVICMIFIFGMLNVFAGWGFVPVSLAFSIFMFMLELLVAAIQAFIFANLTAVFLGQAIEESHEHAADNHGSHTAIESNAHAIENKSK